MQPVALEWTTEVAIAAWLVDRMGGFAEGVGSVVPMGFDAYARVFHPLQNGPDRRWADLAARNGRIAHPEMQLHLIAHPPGIAPPAYEHPAEVAEGSLPPEQLEALVEVMRRHTGTPDRAVFAVWDGYGAAAGVRYTIPGGRTEPLPPLAPPGVLAAPRLELPGRSYVLLQGDVADAAGVADLFNGDAPNLWWPEDRAWCVASEIDFAWTYVGGSEAVIADVLSCAALEALPARSTDGVTWDSDVLNSALDQAP